MSVVFGKPGTFKFRGRIRGQLTVGYLTINHVLAYNTKQAAKVPTQPFLTNDQQVLLENASLLLQSLRDMKNA